MQLAGIELRLKELKVTSALQPASKPLLAQADKIDASPDYIDYICRMGVGPWQRAENPFYWLDFFDPLRSFCEIWHYEEERFAGWHFFATSLHGECYAFCSSHPGRIFWLDAAADPAGFFDCDFLNFLQHNIDHITWELGMKAKPHSLCNRQSI